MQKTVILEVKNEAEIERFNRMVEDFKHFAENSDPFGSAGFLHGLFDVAIQRVYKEAYASIGKAKDANPYFCAARHVKRCIELSDEIKIEIASAMGDMKRGDLGHDMSPSIQILKKLGLMRD